MNISPRDRFAPQRDTTEFFTDLEREMIGLSSGERIEHLRSAIDGRIVHTTSFGLEGQILLHLISERSIDIDVVTIDTGRLFPETYALWAQTERRYGRRIRALYPDNADLEAQIDRHGIDGFYDSREARTSCCHVRKVAPLRRALAGASAWVTGLRSDQSAHRSRMQLVSFNEQHGLVKLNPLFDWTHDDAVEFARRNDIPVNPLHQQGFVSIGCAPCTRAIKPGDPERAGRWWWEDEDKKECGLHSDTGERRRQAAHRGARGGLKLRAARPTSGLCEGLHGGQT